MNNLFYAQPCTTMYNKADVFYCCYGTYAYMSRSGLQNRLLAQEGQTYVFVYFCHTRTHSLITQLPRGQL